MKMLSSKIILLIWSALFVDLARAEWVEERECDMTYFEGVTEYVADGKVTRDYFLWQPFQLRIILGPHYVMPYTRGCAVFMVDSSGVPTVQDTTIACKLNPQRYRMVEVVLTPVGYEEVALGPRAIRLDTRCDRTPLSIFTNPNDPQQEIELLPDRVWDGRIR